MFDKGFFDGNSTDGTPKLIRKVLQGMPGRLYRDPGVSSGHNRSIGIQRAKGKADYHLFIDADMVLDFLPGFDPSALTEDAYNLRFEGANEEAIRVNDLILRCESLPENYRTSAVPNRALSIEAVKAGPTQTSPSYTFG